MVLFDRRIKTHKSKFILVTSEIVLFGRNLPNWASSSKGKGSGYDVVKSSFHCTDLLGYACKNEKYCGGNSLLHEHDCLKAKVESFHNITYINLLKKTKKTPNSFTYSPNK